MTAIELASPFASNITTMACIEYTRLGGIIPDRIMGQAILIIN